MRTGHLTLGRVFPALRGHSWSERHYGVRRPALKHAHDQSLGTCEWKSQLKKQGGPERLKNMRISPRKKRLRHKREGVERPRNRNSEWKENLSPQQEAGETEQIQIKKKNSQNLRMICCGFGLMLRLCHLGFQNCRRIPHVRSWGSLPPAGSDWWIKLSAANGWAGRQRRDIRIHG